MKTHKIASNLFPVLVLILGFLCYIHNFPHIFDIRLWDESQYMTRGREYGKQIAASYSIAREFSNYEDSSVYPWFYRLISVFVTDPIDLFMYGGAILLFTAYLLGAMAIFGLSRSPLLAVVLSASFVLSGALLTAPRVSFGAIAVLSVGIPLALRFHRICDKAAILSVVAFIVTFIRPEFIWCLYLMSIVAVASFAAAIWLRLTEGRTNMRAIIGGTAIPVVCFASVAMLSIAWSFPIPNSGRRAFVAFGQHYSLRYLTTHGLSIDPWFHFRDVMAIEFPGAATVGMAIRSAPDKVLKFYASNLRDLIITIWDFVSLTVMNNWEFFGIVVVAFIGWAMWHHTISKNKPWSPQPPRASHDWHSIDVVLITLFLVPPLLGCILVYPRPHYIIMTEFMLCLIIARLSRRLRLPSSTFLVTAIGIAFLLLAKPLPAVDQPNLKIVYELRGLPPMHKMLEADGGWCYYLEPPCLPYFADAIPAGVALESFLDKNDIGAILVSPDLQRGGESHPTSALNSLLQDPGHDGWVSHDLGQGYSILYRPL